MSGEFARRGLSRSGNGPPVVFLHGVLMNGTLWGNVVDRLGDLGEVSGVPCPRVWQLGREVFQPHD